MAFNINQFRGELEQGGARAALFEVVLTPPPGGLLNGLEKSIFMVRTAQLPSSTVSTLTPSYFGRQIKLAGNRTFEDWTVTIINDEDFKLRNSFEEWHQRINGFTSNVRDFGASPEQYKAQAKVRQFSKTGDEIAEYTFVGFYPNNIAAIDLAWDADAIEEFTVTWSYDYWIRSGTTIPQGAAS